MPTFVQEAAGSSREPWLFLLRVWQEDGGFRAALRPVQGAEAPAFFTDPQALARHLAGLAQGGASTDRTAT
jgi:hypothetical protein